MDRILLCILCLWGILACQSQPETAAVTEAKAMNTSSTPPKTSTPTDSSFLTKAYLMGQFDPAQHPDFVPIDPKYADKDDLFLRKETYEAFLKMHEAAKAEGINLIIRSATRPFPHQKRIWEGKWFGSRKVEGKDLSKSIPDPTERALKILEFSSMPGTSRHHWGTDIDLNAFENSYFESGKGLEEYNWLVANGTKFGFCQVYSEKGADRPHGYNLEKWHWSYLPIAQQLTNFAESSLKDQDIAGFMGAEVAPIIGVVEKYVLGINPGCR